MSLPPLPPDKRFAVLVWGPAMPYRCTIPMTLEDAFYMRQDMIDNGVTGEQFSRIIEMYEPEPLRRHLEEG